MGKGEEEDSGQEPESEMDDGKGKEDVIGERKLSDVPSFKISGDDEEPKPESEVSVLYFLLKDCALFWMHAFGLGHFSSVFLKANIQC